MNASVLCGAITRNHWLRTHSSARESNGNVIWLFAVGWKVVMMWYAPYEKVLIELVK